MTYTENKKILRFPITPSHTSNILLHSHSVPITPEQHPFSSAVYAHNSSKRISYTSQDLLQGRQDILGNYSSTSLSPLTLTPQKGNRSMIETEDITHHHTHPESHRILTPPVPTTPDKQPPSITLPLQALKLNPPIPSQALSIPLTYTVSDGFHFQNSSSQLQSKLPNLKKSASTFGHSYTSAAFVERGIQANVDINLSHNYLPPSPPGKLTIHNLLNLQNTFGMNRVKGSLAQREKLKEKHRRNSNSNLKERENQETKKHLKAKVKQRKEKERVTGIGMARKRIYRERNQTTSGGSEIDHYEEVYQEMFYLLIGKDQF